MTRDEAVAVLSQVCGKFVGTIADCDLVREAFTLLTAVEEPEPDEGG